MLQRTANAVSRCLHGTPTSFGVHYGRASSSRLFHASRASTIAQARSLGQQAQRQQATEPTSRSGPSSALPNGSNPAMSLPCVDQNESRAARIQRERLQSATSASIELPHLPRQDGTPQNGDDDVGPEPAYANIVSGYQLYHHSAPFPLDYGGHLPEFQIAYETWGTLNADKSNCVLLHTGLSASSHAHSTDANPAEGWWEKFIGPGRAIDTNKFFVVCTNVLGGCYGSTGPSSRDPSDGLPYATRFPVLSIFDMVRAQFHLMTHLGIDKLYASVGSSMGGMQSLAAAYVEPERVGKVVSISATARSSPASIAMRHAQRSVLMADPNWKRGFYYDDMPPHTGMKLARQIATITYRSGPEWEQRFARRRRDLSARHDVDSGEESEPTLPSGPVLCPDFLIETYLDHQGEQFCLKYDANSLIYISKAMDLFDMSRDSLDDLAARRRARDSGTLEGASCQVPSASASSSASAKRTKQNEPSRQGKAVASKPFISSLPSSHAYLPSLAAGLAAHRHPTLVMGVQSDTLFPIEQQRELAECLKANGNDHVLYYELNQPWGHDTFLLDLSNVGSAVKGFLESSE